MLTLQQTGLFCAVQKPFFKARLDMDLSLLPKSQVLWFNTMKTTKRFTRGKTSNHHYFILKTCDNKHHIAFLWENYKSNVYSKCFEHTFEMLHWVSLQQESALSKSPNFSYSRNSDFDNAQDYTSAVFPDSFSSSPWLSCPMSPVPLSLFCTKAFLSQTEETNSTLLNTHGKAQRAPRATSSRGNTGKAQRAASSLLLLTFTLEALLDQPPEQAATVVTEGGAHVVVDSEAVGHVDVEPLLLELSTATRISPHPAEMDLPPPCTHPSHSSQPFLAWKLCPLRVTELYTTSSKDRTLGCTAKHLPNGAVSFSYKVLLVQQCLIA